jgi:hypothetical protein
MNTESDRIDSLNSGFQSAIDYEHPRPPASESLAPLTAGEASARFGRALCFASLLYLALMPIPMCCIVAYGITPALLGLPICLGTWSFSKSLTTRRVAAFGMMFALGAVLLLGARILILSILGFY